MILQPSLVWIFLVFFSSFIVLFLFFSIFFTAWNNFKARFGVVKVVYLGDLVQSIDTDLINPVIYVWHFKTRIYLFNLGTGLSLLAGKNLCISLRSVIKT